MKDTAEPVIDLLPARLSEPVVRSGGLHLPLQLYFCDPPICAPRQLALAMFVAPPRVVREELVAREPEEKEVLINMTFRIT